MAKKKPKAATPRAKRASAADGEKSVVPIPEEEPGEFSPTERDLQAFEMHSRGISANEIARTLQQSRASVLERVRKTAEWWRFEKIGEITEIRTQSVALLMRHYNELDALWQASIKNCSGKTAQPGDPIRLDRPIQIVKEMRNTLESIGKFLGAYVDPEDNPAGGESERVAGMSRADVIQRTISKYTRMYEREIVIEQMKPQKDSEGDHGR